MTVACSVHHKHQDEPETSESHHVIPLGWKGPDIPSNRAPLCPTGHSDVHILLNLLVLGGGLLPTYVKWRRWNTATRALAQRGYDEAIAKGLKPKFL